MPDWVDEQLAGVDGPRPLPPSLRDRLERALASSAPADRPAPTGPTLDDSVTARLAGTLSDPLSPWMDSLDAPRPLPPNTRLRMEKALGAKRPRRRLLLGASAAVVLVLAGIGTAAIEAGPGSRATPSSAAGPLSPGTGDAHSPRAGVSSSSPAALEPVGNAPGGAQTPAAAPGQVSDGAAAPAGPTVTALDPRQGPVGGGNWVTLTGTAMSGATEVLFGSTPAHFTVISPSELRAQAPARPAGTVDVSVRTAKGASPPVAGDRYSYG